MASYVDPEAQLVTEIFVRDLRRSISFYQEIGFLLEVERGKFAILTWDRCQLFLDEREMPYEPPSIPAANVRVMVQDVDDIWERVLALGVEVFQPIADRTYGLRDFTILDPDRFGVRFGSRLSISTER